MKSGLDWTYVFRGMALVFVLLAAMMLAIPMLLTAHQLPAGAAKPERLSANPAYWLAFFGLFLYVGV
jgi:fucose permease